MLREIAEQKCYLGPGGLALREGGTVIDAGANIGTSSRCQLPCMSLTVTEVGCTFIQQLAHAITTSCCMIALCQLPVSSSQAQSIIAAIKPSQSRQLHSRDYRSTSRAYAGLFSLWACKGGGGGRPARVLAIEPMPPNLALLRRNMHEHGLTQQARCDNRHTCVPR